MITSPAPAAVPADRPVFVLGERAAALQLVEVLGRTPTLCALPANRLLADLVKAVDRWSPVLGPLTDRRPDGLGPPTSWYRDVQVARLRASSKTRTVEFSGLSILRLCELFPGAQFLVVHPLKRAIPRSRRPVALERERVIEIDSESVTTPDALERALAFLGEATEPVELDLSDHQVTIGGHVVT